ncbi:MAG: fibronectin type III domain-containing protein [Saprospiraceae bacterium]|nr:fibronectin type III domain-containing protein [Saprospiraceae bacterium]
MKQGKPLFRLLQSVVPLFVIFLSMSIQVAAQTFPAGGACPGTVVTCAVPTVTAIDEIAPTCANTRDYNLRVEFVAGGTTTDPSAFLNHYWVMQVITKDSCVYQTNPFTQGSTSGPTYISTTGNSIVVSVAPEDLIFVTGGTNCGTTSSPTVLGGLDSVFVSLQQRCDSPDAGCSTFSAVLGEAIPYSYDLVVSQSNLESPLDSSFYGFCSNNNTIYVDGLQGEEETFNLVWYQDLKQISQFVYVCVQDWDPIAVTENYELALTYGGGIPFTQAVANTWTETGDAIQVATEEVNGQVCYKITYSFDGDGVINPLMNTKITAEAIGNSCQTVTGVTVDTAATAFNKFKIGWRANMQTTNHRFKIRIYQGGTCNMTMANPDTASTRPNGDNSHIQEILINANNAFLTKFSVRDTVGSIVYLTDSFSLDLGAIGLNLQNCTCFQAFVFQVCDGTNTGPSPTWSTGVNVTTDCTSCNDGIQNGDETGTDCGGSCSPCPEFICSAPARLYADNILSTQARLNWFSVSDATLYEVQIKLRSASTWNSTNTTSTSLVVPSLVNGSLYEWRVRSFCGGSFSQWSASCTFVAGNASSSSCLNTSGPQPSCVDGVQNQGETGIDCGGPCTACPEFTCDTPVRIYADNIIGSQARFNWTAVSGATLYQVQVKLRSSTTWNTLNASATTLVATNLSSGSLYEWRVRTYCGAGYSDWSVVCTFVAGDGSSSSCLNTAGAQPSCFDGIRNQGETGIDCGGPCTACPEYNCAPPLTLSATDIASNRVTLNWSAASSASNYEIQIRLSTNSSWYTFTTGQTRMELSGIVPGQLYQWKVRTVCGSGTSEWSVLCTFTGNAGSSSTCTGTGTQPEGGATCFDGIQNQGETGVDCGGPCGPCPELSCEAPAGMFTSEISTDRATLNWSTVGYASQYQVQIKISSSVSWYTFNTSNINISIRGLANRVVYEWRVRSYCGTGYSDWSSICTFVAGNPTSSSCFGPESTPATCFDRIQNQGETGVDCGGPCAACVSCFDGIQNQGETGIDCGGPCIPCPTVESCAAPTGLFVSDLTRSSAQMNWNGVSGADVYVLQIRLSNSSQWFTFTTANTFLKIRGIAYGYDYDWRVYAQCSEDPSNWSDMCTFIGGITTSGNCNNGIPEGQSPNCFDGIRNQGETGIDCGGPCTACATCFDGIQNQGETGVDCGGPCTPCPTCFDGIQNQGEAGVDCGGPCVPCPEVDACTTPTGLYADDITRFSVRLNWTAVPTTQRYYVRFRRLGSNTWINYNTGISTVGLRGVLPGVTYEWSVRALCSDGTFTAWSKSCTFTGGDANSGSCDNASKTPASGSLQGSVVAFPNPTSSGSINVEVAYPDQRDLVLSVRDLSGVELMSQKLSDGTASLNLNISTLNPGVYLLIVQNNQVRTVQRIVVN